MNELKVVLKRVVLGKEFRIYGDYENPLFLAKDVAFWIDHTDMTRMVSLVDDSEKLKRTIYESGQNREMWLLTEDGLYEVLMQSRKPIAKEFKKKVKEILKSVRKNGGYIATTPEMTDAEIMARAVLVAQKTIEEKNKQIDQLSDKIKLDAPKVEFYDAVADSGTAIPMNEVSKILGFKGYGRNKMFEFLRDKKVLMSNNIMVP